MPGRQSIAKSREVQMKRGNARRLTVVMFGIGLVVASGLGWTPKVLAACPFTPTNDVPNDAEAGVPLLFPGPLNVFNVYWSGDWDGNSANFKRADIEKAMKAVIGT